MYISRHAEVRCQQRGIPKDFIDLIINFSKPKRKPGGAFEYSLSKKDKNKIMNHLKILIN